MHIAYPNIILDGLENGIIILDEDLRVHYWNLWMEINTGVKADDIMQNRLQDYFDEIDYIVLLRKIRTSLQLNSATFYSGSGNKKFMTIKRHKVTSSSVNIMQLKITVTPYVVEERKVMLSLYDVSEMQEVKLSLKQEVAKSNAINDLLEQDIRERKFAQRQLEDSEEKFRNIAENALIGIFIYQDKYVYSNNAFANMLGYTISEIYNLYPWEISEKDFQEQIKLIVQRRLNGEIFPKTYDDINIVTKNGQAKIMRITTQTVRYQDKYAGMGSAIDITDIKKTKRQLQLLAQAIEQMDELVRITDKNGIITYVNEALVVHSGYKEEELIGKDINIFRSGKHDKAFYENLWKTISDGDVFRDILINRKKNKKIYYEETTITPILDDDGNIQNYVSTSQDITERVSMEQELQKLATIDSLTGVYNRYKTNEEIDIEIARENRYDGSFALVMLDIDHF